MIRSVFARKTAIVTGAASGIGRALCMELARGGANVVMADRNAPLLAEAAAAIHRGGASVHEAVLDVTDATAVQAMVDETVARWGRLDYLFNNAGIGILGEVRHSGQDFWRSIIDTNLYGVVHGVAAAYPVMVRQGGGHIVNTASLAGLIPVPGEISYTASKYGVVGLSHALRVEGADLGVRVSVVCPGIIDTPILATSPVVNMDHEKAMALLPKRRMRPERCARIILRGVARNRATIIVTGLARFFWVLQRLSPGLVRWIWRMNMRRLRAIQEGEDTRA
jgi:NAD(P)-dependent dehydrogenase (short-subunit alcohol dehydrogenase family)